MGTDIHGFVEERYHSDRLWFRSVEIEDSRNYCLFAALADVRNGYGFAGVPTHKPITPISDPRGLPDDHTLGHGEEAEYEFGDHSFSWLTIDELVAWEGWDQTLDEVGWIKREDYADWLKASGMPRNGWSGGVSGGSVIHAVHDDGFFPEGWTHVRVSWTRPLRQACHVFLAWLDFIKAKTDGHEARLVFGFDS